MANKIATMQYINDLTGRNYSNPTKCGVYGYISSLAVVIDVPVGTYSSNQCVMEKDITVILQQESINTEVTIRNLGPNLVFSITLTFSDGSSNTATANTGGGFSGGSSRTTVMSNSTVYKKDKVSLSKVVISAANGWSNHVLDPRYWGSRIGMSLGTPSPPPSTPSYGTYSLNSSNFKSSSGTPYYHIHIDLNI